MPQPQPVHEFREEKKALLKENHQKKFLQFCRDLNLFIYNYLKIPKENITSKYEEGGFVIKTEVPILLIADKLKEFSVTCQQEQITDLAHKMDKNGQLILPTFKNSSMSAIRLVKNPDSKNGQNIRTEYVGFYMSETSVPI